MLNQKKYKSMKKDVKEETAYGIGFFEGILKVVPEVVVFEVFREISNDGWIDSNTPIPEVKNMIVTKSIELMTYQEFKEVAPYLFSYPQNQREKDRELIVKTIEITEGQYQEFQNAIEELMLLKRDIKSLNKQVSVISEEARYGYQVHDLQESTSGFMNYATGDSLEDILDIRWSDYLDNHEEELIHDKPEGHILDPDYRPDWFDKEFVEDMWEIEIIALSRDDAIRLEVNDFELTEDEQMLKEAAEEQIAFLKNQELWEVGAVDYYEFGYMPDDLIEFLLQDGAYGTEEDRKDYESYFGWFKGGGEVCNTIIAMPGVSFVEDVILGDIALEDDFKVEIEGNQFNKLIDRLSDIEQQKITEKKEQNLSRGL